MPVKIACLISLLLIPLHIFADNPSATDIFSSGERYYNSGDYSEAVVMFREFVMDYPADERTPRAFLYLGSSYLKEGRGDLALARYRMVLDYFPYSEEAPSAVFEMGRIYEGKRDYSASVSAYGLIVSNHRDFEEFPYCEYKLVLIPYERLGRSPSLGRLDSVMGDLERVMEKYPGHELYKDAETAWISCQVQKADLLLSARRWNEARESYRKLLKEYPEYRRRDYLVFRIAYTFNMEGEHDRAISEYKKFLENFPRSSWADFACERIASIYSGFKNDPDKAIYYFEKMKNEYPEGEQTVRGVYILAHIYEQEERYQDAINAFQWLIDIDPRSNIAYRIAGEIRRLQEKTGR